MWWIMVVSITSMFAGIFFAKYLIPEGMRQLIAILSIAVFFMIPCFFALRLEVNVGYYQCKNCGHKIVPTYKAVLMAPHFGTTRRLECPECGKKTYCKKVITKK